LERVLKITLIGKKKVLDRVQAYIKDVLERNMDSAWGGELEGYSIDT